METIIQTGNGRKTWSEEVPEESLDDKTEALTLHSRRTERRRKKLEKKAKNAAAFKPRQLLDLPYEVFDAILSLLVPSDIFALRDTCRPIRQMIGADEHHIAKTVINYRYPCLAKCFRLPVLLENVDEEAHVALTSQDQRKPFQHIQPPDPRLICTCMTCIPRWNILCIAVDFAYWQHSLDKGEPIPVIPRGRSPRWNQKLLARNARIVTKALYSPLQYARILEAHLDSTIRSIRRHAENKGNRRLRFRMTKADERAESDAFLERAGPPSVDVPWHRDNYYLLEAYLPNRAWFMGPRDWVYVPADQHDRDVELVVRWSQSRDRQASQASTA